MALLFSNFSSSTLAAIVSDTDTTVTVQAADGGLFPSPGAGDWFPLVVVKSTGEREIMYCTGRSGAVLTVTRAREGTTALSFSTGARAELRITAGALAAFDELDAVETALALLLAKAGGTMTGDLVLANDPTSALHAATKQYVDGLIASVLTNLGKRGKVKAATAANIDLSAPGATIDDVTMVSGNLFLAKNQSTPAQNGVYQWNGAAAAATRAEDYDAFEELAGAMVIVEQGTAAADTLWLGTSDAGGTLGSTDVVFTQILIVGSASETVAGIMALATNAEAIAGTVTNKALVPSALAAVLAGYLSKSASSQVINGGAVVEPQDHGDKSSGTHTISFGTRPMQSINNRGSFTLAPPASENGHIVFDVINGTGAGTITTSGWSMVVGEFTTTNGDKFRCSASKGPAGSLLQIQPMQ